MAKVEEEGRKRHIQELFYSFSLFLQPLLTPCSLRIGQSENQEMEENALRRVRGSCTGQGKVKSGAIDTIRPPPHGPAPLPMPFPILCLGFPAYPDPMS